MWEYFAHKNGYMQDFPAKQRPYGSILLVPRFTRKILPLMAGADVIEISSNAELSDSPDCGWGRMDCWRLVWEDFAWSAFY